MRVLLNRAIMSFQRSFVSNNLERSCYPGGMAMEATEQAEAASKIETMVTEVGIRPLSFLINMASNIG